MTLRCPRCSTRYRLPAGTRPRTRVTYRCVRCQHVFGSDTASAEPSLLDAEDDLPADHDGADEPFDDEADEPVVVVAAGKREDTARRARAEPSSVSTTTRFALRSVLAVALGYGVLSVYLYTHPHALHRLLSGLPLIGGVLAETRLHPGSIQLTNLRGEFQRVLGDQLAFVISGIAINNSPRAVNGIQIEGRVTGAQDDRRIVFAGTAPHDVQTLSAREIGLLQTLEPPRDWTLAPGDQANFMVVFVGPPSDLREFSAEVVAVQAQRRRRAPITGDPPGAVGALVPR